MYPPCNCILLGANYRGAITHKQYISSTYILFILILRALIQTVNLLDNSFEGSNPSPTTTHKKPIKRAFLCSAQRNSNTLRIFALFTVCAYVLFTAIALYCGGVRENTAIIQQTYSNDSLPARESLPGVTCSGINPGVGITPARKPVLHFPPSFRCHVRAALPDVSIAGKSSAMARLPEVKMRLEQGSGCV